jgi:hypothetical protein
MGRSGAALALLLPSESAYVELLRLRKVPLKEVEKLPGSCPAALILLLAPGSRSDATAPSPCYIPQAMNLPHFCTPHAP